MKRGERRNRQTWEGENGLVPQQEFRGIDEAPGQILQIGAAGGGIREERDQMGQFRRGRRAAQGAPVEVLHRLSRIQRRIRQFGQVVRSSMYQREYT